MSKRTGPTRIPVFGTRIPIQGTTVQPQPIILPHEQDDLISSDKPSVDVSNKDIGKKVRVGDKEGVLRYIGSVQFATGVWCGVELLYPAGKNDGSVRGVRYFHCKDSHGLMAPLSKVTFVETIIEDSISGPYSMLFGLKEQLLSNCSLRNPCNAINFPKDLPFQSELRPLIKSNTFEKLDATILDRKNCTVTKDATKDPKNLNTGSNCDYFAADQIDYCNETIVHRNIESETFNVETKDCTVCIQERKHINNSIIVQNKGSVLNRPFTITRSETNTEKHINHKENPPNFKNLASHPEAPESYTKINYKEVTQICKQVPQNSVDSPYTYTDKPHKYKEFPQRHKESSKIYIEDPKNFAEAHHKFKETLQNYTEVPPNYKDLIQNHKEIPQNLATKDPANLTFNRSRRRTYNIIKTLEVEEIVKSQNNTYTSISNETFQRHKLLDENQVRGKAPSNSDSFSVPCPKRRCFEENSETPPNRNPGKTYETPSRKTFDTSTIAETSVNSKDSTNCKRSLRISLLSDSFNDFAQAKFLQSTPARKELEPENSPRRLRVSPAQFNSQEDDTSKRDSLEFEESLGILTPEQMMEVGSGFVGSRTPSSENIRSLTQDLQNIKYKQDTHGKMELSSPNLVDASVKEFSLGIIDEQLLSNFTMKSDPAVNMELALDSIKHSKEFDLTRLDQTPSPEDLPLDPVPISTLTDSSKLEPGNKKSVNSFITSITSITSLDTGYQGDGEMSRPASRGADNSPLTRRPLPRPQPRRPDPMTDSDFYTESDADNHEEHPLRGDRKAQVIDGTLYGVDPQAAADIYVNNRENMDSSGIFTDIESNPRTEDISTSDPNQNMVLDVSPSESSTKTISDNSQGNVALIMNKSKTENINETIAEAKVNDVPKRSTPSPSTVASSPTSIRSPKHVIKDNNRNYKMPKRNVPSKVKAMLEPSMPGEKVDRKVPVKKTVGRWDAVMNKISKSPGDQLKTNLKDVKSKVFSASTPSNLVQRSTENRKAPLRQQANQKTPNAKIRRVRARASTNTTPTKGTNLESSIHSSLSDISGASPAKKNGPAKKRDVGRVTQVLTASKLSSRQPQNNQSVSTEAKKATTTPSANEAKLNRRNVLNTKEKKQIAQKECGRGTVKGGRVSPVTRPPQQQRAPIKSSPRTAEALAVLVQHLVFNLEAFSVPTLKKEIEKIHKEAEDARLANMQLEERLNEEHLSNSKLKDQLKNTIAQISHEHSEKEQKLLIENENIKQQLTKLHEEQVHNFKVEFNKLQKTHEESLDILREENDAIREQIDEKNIEINILKHNKFESEKLRKDYEAKELVYKEQLQAANEELMRIKEESERFACMPFDGNDTLQEIQSLRAVLELKQSEVAELRKTLGEASQKVDLLPSVEEKVLTLTARCEDLQLQLERKSDYEQQLLQENKKLNDSFKEEINQKKRLAQYNEELQWKLRQNKEILTRVVEQTDDASFHRTGTLSSSFSERHNSTRLSNLERTLSFRERSFSNQSSMSIDSSYRSRKSKNCSELDMDDISPPSSPKVKGVVEKSDSVSYVLEMDESPDVVASRIVRRSFRNSTPPKNTPTKSPVNKRPRMKNNPLSLSMSASSIISAGKSDHVRSRSVSVRNEDETGSSCSDDIFIWETKVSSTPKLESNFLSKDDMKFENNLDLDDDHDVEIKLPSLPSEIGRKHCVQSLPVPKHLAGEAMVSESNSEDESTNSSSSGQL